MRDMIKSAFPVDNGNAAVLPDGRWRGALILVAAERAKDFPQKRFT